MLRDLISASTGPIHLAAKTMCEWRRQSDNTYCECLEVISVEELERLVLKWAASNNSFEM